AATATVLAAYEPELVCAPAESWCAVRRRGCGAWVEACVGGCRVPDGQATESPSGRKPEDPVGWGAESPAGQRLEEPGGGGTVSSAGRRMEAGRGRETMGR